ncbi:MAG: exodeoxyribonuclease VII small subunit [Actinobacteria bacterium RBG_19FT_COMBO_36_27]|nr:MAG: exodeoxyribonuclease VII small subunit [Actinobacteria bacterium RBG_19FT_COMBO_36_27]OGD33656.1 MAG: exodeoxyribonuclease VII small subunit [Candidatus Atribacteria bacterium RBG_16_35_8]
MEIEKLSFEKSIEKLEEIVRELEDENISLEESMEKFEMGIKLSSNCLNKLNEAENRIEELTRSEDGKLITKELDLEKEN